MSQEVTLLAAFAAGFLSFISPCVLPLIPGYISFISGMTLEEMQGTPTGASARGLTQPCLIASLAFVLGFTSSSSPRARARPRSASSCYAYAPILEKIAGTHPDRARPAHDGRVPDPAARERQADPHRRRSRPGRSARCSSGWRSPSPGRRASARSSAASSAMAASRESVAEGMQMLAVYSLGLGVPFLLTSVAINQFFAAAARIRRHYRMIELVSGGAADRGRAADLLRPVHADRQVPDAVSANVLTLSVSSFQLPVLETGYWQLATS